MNSTTTMCWADRLEWTRETYGYLSDEYIAYVHMEADHTCLLPDGHNGPHVWIVSDEIVIEFAAASR